MTPTIRLILLCGLGGLACLSAGCADPPVLRENPTMNTWAIRNYIDPSVEQAILVQHTLFPYHFETGSSMFNELGGYDFAVLAAHYCRWPGRLNVRRGDADDQLYQARLAYVRQALTEYGVPEDRVAIADDAAGGPGLPAERVVVIMGGRATTPVYPANPPAPSAVGTSLLNAIVAPPGENQ